MIVNNYIEDSEDEESNKTLTQLKNQKQNSTLTSAKSLNIKNDIIKLIKSEIAEYNNKLQFLYINKENFSKATKIEIEEFSTLIKNNEEAFTLYEKEKMIFTQDKHHTHTNHTHTTPFLDSSFLNIIKTSLDMILLKLNSLKKNLEISFSNDNKNKTVSLMESKDIISLIENINRMINSDTHYAIN